MRGEVGGVDRSIERDKALSHSCIQSRYDCQPIIGAGAGMINLPRAKGDPPDWPKLGRRCWGGRYAMLDPRGFTQTQISLCHHIHTWLLALETLKIKMVLASLERQNHKITKKERWEEKERERGSPSLNS